jgi:hypothetical protein
MWPTQEAVDGDAERLAGEIPQRQLEPAMAICVAP